MEILLNSWVTEVEAKKDYDAAWKTDIDMLMSGKKDWQQFYEKVRAIPAPKMFGTSGIRGVAAINDEPDLTPLNAYALGVALSKMGKLIVIAHDARISNKALAYALAAGITKNGSKVHYLGNATTGNVQWAVRQTDAVLGAMITASHNPPPDNGIKVFGSDGIELSDEDTHTIQDDYLSIYKGFTFENDFMTTLNKIIPLVSENLIVIDDSHKTTYSQRIRKEIKSLIPDLQELMGEKKLVIDAGNSVGAMYVPTIFEGLPVKMLYGALDGMFSGRHSEPTEENLQDQMKLMATEPTFLGFAIDGDADRAVFSYVDDKPLIPNLNDLAALFILAGIKEYVNKPEKLFVAKTVTTTDLIKSIAQKHSVELGETPVGSRFLGNALVEAKKNNMFPIVGVEDSAGIVYDEFTDGKDGFFALVKVLKYLGTFKLTLKEALDDLKNYGHFTRFKTNLYLKNNDDKAALLDDCEKKMLSSSASVCVVRDALKISDKAGWIVARPSGTEPKFRVYAETTNVEKTNALFDQILPIINKYAKEPLTINWE